MDAKMNYRVKHRGGEWELRYSSENTFWFWISRSRNTGGAFKGPYKSESSPMTCELELGLRDLLQMQWQSLQQWLPCLASTLPERKPYYCTLPLPTTVPSPTYKNKLQFGSPLCYLRCFRHNGSQEIWSACFSRQSGSCLLAFDCCTLYNAPVHAVTQWSHIQIKNSTDLL